MESEATGEQMVQTAERTQLRVGGVLSAESSANHGPCSLSCL